MAAVLLRGCVGGGVLRYDQIFKYVGDGGGEGRGGGRREKYIEKNKYINHNFEEEIVVGF